MGKPKTVAPPDPVATAQAQSQANLQTAQEQQRLNMIGTVGPQGTTGYRADDSQPGGFVQYTNLSPQEQQSYDLTKLAENAALGVAGQQIGRVGEALGRPLDLSTLPGMQTSVGGQSMQTAFNMGGPLQYGFDPGQQVQGQVGGNLDQARQQAIDAVYGQATSRLDPQFQQREEALRVQLSNQGLAPGSVAWEREMSQLGRDRSDAYNQATYGSIGAGEQAAQNLFGRQLGQGQFANQAAGQMYQQNMGQAAFNNQTAGQDFGQNLGAAEFGNQARQAQFQQDMTAAQFANQARQQALQEQAYVQNQPLNQFSALMGLSQVGLPQGVQYTPSQVGQTDVLGAYALNQQAQQANAARTASAQQGLMGGLFQLGSAAMLSDVRLKRDVQKVGERPDGLGVYLFRYLWSPIWYVGALAQEVLRVKPEAVVTTPEGWLAVRYGWL